MVTKMDAMSDFDNLPVVEKPSVETQKTGRRILVVDDEPTIRRYLNAILKAHNFTVSEARNGQEALQAVIQYRPELIILDLGLPDIDGVEVTRQLREWSQTPIIILSVREAEQDKIDALDAGADDYLTKPFGSGELLARLRSALRRSDGMKQGGEPIIIVADITIDLSRRVAMKSDQEISLTPTEYDLLRLFMQNAGRVLTHRQIIRKVWGGGYDDEMHLLRVNISNLRRKIENDPTRPHLLMTEPGVGYRFRSE